MYTESRPAFDAKNRFDLPFAMPLDWKTFGDAIRVFYGLKENGQFVYDKFGAYVPAVGAVQRWFVRRRGFASGLAVSGIGVGTLAMPPLATLAIEGLGWRGAYLMLGVLAAVVGGGMALLIENDPRDRGLGPDGDPPQAGIASARREGASVAEAVRSRRFIALYAACLICSFGVFVPFVHLVPYAGDHGVAPSTAVLLLGVIGVGSTAGRFFLGGLADRLGRQTSLLLMFVGMAFALAIWMVSTSL